MWYIIVFTLIWSLSLEFVHGDRPTQRGQAPRAAAAGEPQSAPRCRDASAVSGRRVLRSSRSAAGQVRDAARGARGQAADQRGGQGVRFLPPVVLSGSGGLRTGRTGRSDSAEDRAA